MGLHSCCQARSIVHFARSGKMLIQNDFLAVPRPDGGIALQSASIYLPHESEAQR